MTEANIVGNEIVPSPEAVKPGKAKILKLIFDKRDEELLEHLNEKKSARYQLNLLGHAKINKTCMLYSRNLGLFENQSIIYNYLFNNLKFNR